jgi:putative FmdB family regulatory protein
VPIYEYRCESCGDVTEALVRSGRERAEVRCEKCGKGRLQRAYRSPMAPVPSAQGEEATPWGGRSNPCAARRAICEECEAA